LFLPNYESKKPPEMTPGAFSSTVVDEFGRPGNAGMPMSRTPLYSLWRRKFRHGLMIQCLLTA
jgi:hypothetical protein